MRSEAELKALLGDFENELRSFLLEFKNRPKAQETFYFKERKSNLESKIALLRWVIG